MKKTLLILIGLFLVITVTGCGSEKTLTCTTNSKGTNMNAYGKWELVFKDDKLKNTKLTATFKDITITDIDKYWDSYKKQFTEQNKPVKETGYKRYVKSNDKKHEFSVIIEVDYNKISKDIMKKYSIEDYKNRSYKAIKKEIKSSVDGIKCEG